MAKIVFCSTCDTGPGAKPLERFTREVETELQNTGLGEIGIRRTECMGACEDPLAVALRGEGLATYLFAGINPEEDAADVAATCKVWLESPQGWIGNALGCGRLRHCLRARIPAL